MPNYREILAAITQDPRYVANLDWGEPRFGHPEGSVRAHIVGLERNLKTLKPKLNSEEEYWKLKVLIHTHDSFKAEAKQGVSLDHPQSHASLARTFLSDYCDDPDLLAMVQYHDLPYAIWRQWRHRGSYPPERLDSLLETIADWHLFLAFLIVDGCTEGKLREPLYWFLEQIAGRVETMWGEWDVL